ncbi:MAG: PIG-L family deacetylase [Candidatus Promineofilum sp.]|nr:PIG-L family deacetylase [Promineifilum sp.]
MIQLQPSYDSLYLSPHFDDVALSCGGQIFRRTAVDDSVLVVTITGAEPPDGPLSETVQSLHRRWADSLGQTPAAMVAQRRAEDREAFDILRADVLHLPFLDCIYRAGPDGRPLYPGPTDMFGTPRPDDAGTIDQLAAALAALPPADHIYLPLGVGGHVDHGLTRSAAERVFDDVAYYEDYPYTMTPGALAAVLPAAGRGQWRAETMWLTETALAAKIESVAAYHSQLSSFFTGLDDLADKLRREGRRVLDEARAGSEEVPVWAAAAERLWRRRPTFTLPSFEE